MAEPMRPAMRMDIMTGASSLHMAMPDQPADGVGDAAFREHRAGQQRDDAADEKGKDADHQQAGVADFKKLVEHLLALPPEQAAARATSSGRGASFHQGFETYIWPSNYCRAPSPARVALPCPTECSTRATVCLPHGIHTGKDRRGARFFSFGASCPAGRDSTAATGCPRRSSGSAPSARTE